MGWFFYGVARTNTNEGEIMTKVVHCKREDYDVYIGRGRCPRTRKLGIWGNPFSIGRDGNREEVIEKYRKWIMTQQHLLDRIHELKNKRLGCWCAPQACHGDVLKELADET